MGGQHNIAVANRQRDVSAGKSPPLPAATVVRPCSILVTDARTGRTPADSSPYVIALSLASFSIADFSKMH